MTNHPITPPLELVRQWWTDAQTLESNESQEIRFIVNAAAQWGADQELEACCEWTRDSDGYDASLGLRAARRPKPPSLKEQALLQLDTLNEDLAMHGRGCDLSQIRRALEALPND